MTLSLTRALAICAATVVAGTANARAQTTGAGPVAIGAHMSVLRLSEFDTTDVGVGVDASWYIRPGLAIDGTLDLFPGKDQIEADLVDQRRVLGLVGARYGMTFGRVEIFGRLRGGFLNFADEGPVACILIVPSPLGCQLADGHTAFATDIGGGAIARLDRAGRWRIRVDVGDLLVRYDTGEPFRRADMDVSDGFVGHNLLLNIGVNWRF